MNTQLLNLPVNIPWKLMTTSSDMMDTSFCSKTFPSAFRSSLALFAYEPKPEELDEGLCDQRILFLKIACSITGYQPTEEETVAILEYPDVSPKDLEQIARTYFACYGVLLNVSVHPDGKADLGAYPHIIDFEPKKRDLYQAATETGEVLTASREEVKSDKSLTNTSSTETGLKLGAEVPLGDAAKATSEGTQKWGSTTQDASLTSTDTSRERRETAGTTTNLTQMYNLLTGYHVGTNRAVFVMLPRPHTLQPSAFRTFIDGVREIEGVQEFFLVVSRPKDANHVCVEVMLETGHFPEDVEIDKPEITYDTDTKTVDVNEPLLKGGFFGAEREFSHTYTGFEVDGWQFNPKKGDTGHGSAEEQIVANYPLKDHPETDTAYEGYIENYDYYTSSPDKLTVSAKIKTGPGFDTKFHRKYKIYLRRPRGTTTPNETADATRLLITRRSLCACLVAENDGCLKLKRGPFAGIDFGDIIIDEPPFADIAGPFIGPSGISYTQAYRRIHAKLTSSARMPWRRPETGRTFLDTDYFKGRIRRVLNKSVLDQTIEGSPLPAGVRDRLGNSTTLNDVLAMTLPQFAHQAGVTIAQALELRRVLLRIPAVTARTPGQ